MWVGCSCICAVDAWNRRRYPSSTWLVVVGSCDWRNCVRRWGFAVELGLCECEMERDDLNVVLSFVSWFGEEGRESSVETDFRCLLTQAAC